MRRNEEETVRAVLEWRPTGKSSPVLRRKMWMETVKEDLKKIGLREWGTI